MKTCSKCNKLKQFKEFNKRSDNHSLRSHCKSCCSAEVSKNYRLKHPKRPELSYLEKRSRKLAVYKKHNAKPERKIKQAACEANRRAQKLNATPKWLSEKDHNHILAYYESAAMFSRLFGIQMDVDHIIPLRSKTICGLHVPWNMQLLEHSANVEKGNRYE